MAAGLQVWSQTASSNSTSDSAVNYAEGMAPSALNDSGRGLMASMAKWRDDINGTITTGGSSGAYTVTTNQTQAALTAGYMVAFVPHATNAATVTLNVDSLGAKPLRSAPGVELPAGALVLGTPYVATYYTSNSGEWILHGFYGNPYSIPIGGVLPYLGTTAPNSSFVLPYGQAISRTTYSTLFSLVSTTFGIGDGTTTFNVPDFRGRVPAGKDDMGGSAASRLTSTVMSPDGVTVGATGGAQTVTLDADKIPSHTHSLTIDDHPKSRIVELNNSAIYYASSGATSGATNSAFRTASELDGNLSTPVLAHSATIGNTGGSSAHNNVQPTIIVPFILRVI